MANYSQDIKPRIRLLDHHSKKPCLYGQCNIETGVCCKRHLDSSAIVRRYLELKKFRVQPLSEARIEQTIGTYRHADRAEWRRRFPI